MNDTQRIRALFLITIGYFTFLITLFFFTEVDPYMHIKVGEWIVSNHQIPHTGIFSQTKADAPWISHSWLSEVIMYIIFNFLGWPGLVVMTIAAITAGIFVMLKYLLEQLSPIRALCLTVLSYGMLTQHILPRPHILALPLMTYWFVRMLRASEAHKAPPLHLALILILWANIHGSFLISIVYACFFALESVTTAPAGTNRVQLTKQWGKFLTASLACLMVTPYGLQGILLPLQLTDQSYSMSIINEWSSPNFQRFQFLEVMLFIILGFALTQKLQLPILRLVLLIGLIHLSLKHARYASDLMSMQVPLLFAAPLSRHWREAEPSNTRFQLSSLIPVSRKGKLLIIPVIICWFIYIFTFKNIEFDQFKKINTMLSSIKKANLPGNVFNHYNLGTFLIYHDFKPFIDTRAELYQDDFIKAYMEAETLKDGEKPIVNLLNKYSIDWTFLMPNTPAIAYFNLNSDWIQIFTDDDVVIHVRKGLWSSQEVDNLREELKAISKNSVKTARK